MTGYRLPDMKRDGKQTTLNADKRIEIHEQHCLPTDTLPDIDRDECQERKERDTNNLHSQAEPVGKYLNVINRINLRNMPNWCETIYKVTGAPKEVRSLYEIISENSKRKEPRVRNGFGNLWLRCIIDQLGFDWEKYRCRGEILDFTLEEDMLTIVQMTAWCEQEGFRQCIEEKYPNVRVYFLEEEPGCCVYVTNDACGEYFPERYHLDSPEESMHFETIEEAAEYVESLAGRKVKPTMQSIEKILDGYMKRKEEEDPDFYCYFHEIRVIVDD